MLKHLLDEEEFYLRDRAYHRMIAGKYPDLREICDRNTELDFSIVLISKQQIKEERDGSEKFLDSKGYGGCCIV